MKVKISIILLLMINFTCQAQSEPEPVRGKDLIEKIDRADIEANNIEEPIGLDTSVPKINFQKIEFEKPTKKPRKTTTKVQAEPKPVVSNKTKPKTVVSEKESTKNRKILISSRSLSLGHLLINDKVAKNNGITYIYRGVNLKTVQYKYKGKMPFSSKGLKVISDNRYLIVDLGILKSDSKLTKYKPNINKPVKKVTTPKQPAVVKKSSTQPKKVTPSPEKISSLTEIDKIKQRMEKVHNRGKTISKSISLKHINKNDVIFISGEVQLLVRRNTRKFKIEYYWLTEKIDPKSESLRALSNTHYKVIKHKYEPRK